MLVLAPAVAIVGAINDHPGVFPPPRRASCSRSAAVARPRRVSTGRRTGTA